MNEKSRNLSTNLNIFQGITNHVKLITRLMMDSRVHPLLKLLPVGTLVYLVVPTDLMPLLPFDDAAIIWAGTYLFVELCPQELVAAYRRDIAAQAGPEQPGDAPANPAAAGDTVDAEYRDLN